MNPQPSAAHGAERPHEMRVLVVDDQRVVREGITRLIHAGIAPPVIVDAAASSTEALSVAARFAPHVVVLDVDLAGEDGLDLIPRLAPPERVLILTSHGDAATRQRAHALGAVAFVEKHEPAAVLIAQLQAMAVRPARGEQAPGHPGAGSRGGLGASSSGWPGPERSK